MSALTTPYKTPRRPLAHRQPITARSTTKAKAVDLVTGKAVVEYFFDPSLVMPSEDSSNFTTPFKPPSSKAIVSPADIDDTLYSSKHLFVPCTIIKRLDDDDSNDSNNKKANTEPYEGPTLVKTNDGALHKIYDSSKLISLSAPEDYIGMDDILHLPHVTEASLLHNLRIRYKRDDIYTSAGPILISINPYRVITIGNGESLYSEELMMQYRAQTGLGQEKRPHLFQVADRAYQAMMDSVHPSMDFMHMEDEDVDLVTDLHMPPGRARNQSIIISGESGAGKTEATKYIMQYLARITKSSTKGNSASNPLMSPDGKMIAALEDRVLSSNPLLETFGNAQTLRNDNSSRFGKYIHIFFSTDSGAITGASISNYLLEKTRITQQVEGERNYHIFYQLLAGADDELLEKLGLDGGSEAFHYLGCRESSSNTANDAANFAETRACLSRIGLSDEEQEQLFATTAAVLHLGNVKFEEVGDDGEAGHHEHARITDESMPSLQKACELLGLQVDQVSDAILTKNITVGGKTIKKAQTVDNAAEKRDALAKLTYSSAFVWLVTCVNETLDRTSQQVVPTKRNGKLGKVKTDEDDSVFIGVLDIYGFECFEENGYEQLLINYCNEKLQRQFNQNVFTVEQNLYSTEGIDWTYITFNDNRPCLDLIEGGSGTVGILNTLDDAWGGMGNATEKDIKFLNQLHKTYGTVPGTEVKKPSERSERSHDYFVTPKFGKDNQFIVVHFAGEVRYTVDGFVEKNMETLSTELRSLGYDSTINLVQAVFSCGSVGGNPSPKRSSIRGVSVGSQFRTSLQALVSDLERTQPHYIRCIKPNLRKSPNAFSSGEVLKQLRYSGMMEAIRIRREGYALREDHESFYNRFSVLLSQEDLDSGSGIEHLVQVLSKRLNVTDADWQIGHSKIFLRRELSDKLERLATLRVHMAVRTLGRFGKRVATMRVNRLLVPFFRFRLHMRRVYKQQRAATKISASCRSHMAKKRYRSILLAMIKLQAFQRRKMAIAYAEKLRDPYLGMTYKDVKKLLAKEEARLEEVVKEKDFKAAAELEAKIADIKEALLARKPLTRSVLEEQISKAEQDFAEALSRKDYAACDPLQKKLDELKSKRKDLPTMEELKEEVRKAKEAVAAAAATRNFTAAAEAQTKLDLATSRFEEAMANENDSDSDDDGSLAQNKAAANGITSRAQLEQQIADIHKTMDEAIASKDFKRASELQQDLDVLESLRKMFPSLEEMEHDLKKMKLEVAEAIQKKDFAKAGDLHERIDRLEDTIKQEHQRLKETSDVSAAGTSATIVNLEGTTQTFETRADLEKEITSVSAKMSEAVASKDFGRAQELSTMSEKLENLRKLLPSVAELEVKVRDLKKEFDQAVASKDFALADRINKNVEDTEKKLEKERAKQPKEAAEKKPTVAPKAATAATVKSAVKGPTVAVAKAVTPKPAARARASNDDDKSVRSMPVMMTPAKSTDATSIQSLPVTKTPKLQVKPVSKLRPKPPITGSSNDTILSVVKSLAAKRSAASLITDATGGLCGILTDTDVTRRVVAKDVNPSSPVSDVMTPNPICVSTTDSALDALGTMIENRFRHLPVVDPSGGVVGLLDIAKCLNDAINKLEKSEAKSSNTAEDAVKQVLGNQNAGDAHALALQALLGQVLSQAFGSQPTPTLRSLLSGKPTTVVSPTTSIREAGKLMAGSRKAALIVEDGKLTGIFGFKDMMTRAVAKELPLDSTEVSAVMTEHPESALPETTVLEALQTMHDHKFLSLPVCAANGEVLGVVDVMDVINGCGGANGWRSIFSSAMDIEDDDSDASSITGSVTSYKSASKKSKYSTKATPAKMKPLAESSHERSVAKLRPRKPLCSHSVDTVLSVAQMLASKRGDASLVLDGNGALSGILTDKDITKRLVQKSLDASTTNAETIMTPNPTCVHLSDSAMDALGTMIDNHFRHLPVVDDNGAVVGLLDMAKCLNDAITHLEKAESKKKDGLSGEALQNVLNLQGTGDAHAQALQALLGQVLSQAFGDQSTPTLRNIVAGKASAIVSPTTSLRDAGKLMANTQKAALVVENGKLAGIFGFKDMMTRAVAKELPLDSTAVASVMTEHPESALPETTVLEALQIMHDHKFMTLPVCAANGDVLGVVDVMDVINGCGGADGWRSIFSKAMEVDDDDSDASSVNSFQSKKKKSPATKAPDGRMEKLAESSEERPVSKLRPKKPLISGSADSVMTVTQMLASKRADASIVVGADGGLAGIVTDVDITRRVVAKSLDPSVTDVAAVMTPNPMCVGNEDSAMDAMAIMVENHFRHLPVLDNQGSVVGVLDIAKCLHDAISKLEKSVDKNSSAADEVVKQVVGKQGGDPHTLALQALLGQVMSKAFGNQTSPTLGSILGDRPAPTVVSPGTSVREAGLLMAEHRKAALVVEDGELIGIFGFKDMMTRVVAKGLPPDSTPVLTVMTANPETVSSDITVLDAMQLMHDNKFLTLPVCDNNGSVKGVVSVMDVILACGGEKGWRSIFSQTIDMDDLSESASAYSRESGLRSRSASVKSKKAKKEQVRPVKKLRPKKPMMSGAEDSILSVTQMLASKRADASIVVGTDGTLAGIVTDVDITRRVVAKKVNPSATEVSSVMTPHPTCVATSDSAMDAMATMVENHFRHLPVLDDDGTVVGVLDIAKCLNDAISKLEKSVEKSSSAAEDVVKQVVSSQGSGGAQALALQALLGQVMSTAFGNQTSPTLRSLLAGKPPSTVVSPDTSVYEAGLLMAEHRKAALVVEEGQLVGIFGFKDMMTRVVAKELPTESTHVSDVMTPSPESVSADITVLEAMQMMHDNKFLTLPVCDGNQRVLGVVDVMDVILACGGEQGWRSIFSQTMDMEDLSDTASVYSQGSRARSVKVSKSGAASVSGSMRGGKQDKDTRSVSRLRPKKAILSGEDDSVLAVTQLLASKRSDAGLIVKSNGELAGIVTDVDITRRVIAKSVDPSNTDVSRVMTANPTCVHMSDSAMDAMGTMVDNHFRHLPVLDDDGGVAGVLDIARCLNDAISKLEKSVDKSSSAAEDVVKQVVGQQGANGAQALALQALLGQVMSQAFGNQASPSLGSLLAGRPPTTVVSPNTSVRNAGLLMAEYRKAALVVEDDELIGIFGFKDMMTRVVAKELSPDDTLVEEVMTPHPDTVSPSLTVLEAMQVMHDNKFLTLPVVDDRGTVLGVVDVMDLILACGGKDGWRSIFSNAIDCGSVSDDISASGSRVGELPVIKAPPSARVVAPRTPMMQGSPIPHNIPTTLEFHAADDASTINDTRVESQSRIHDGLSISDAPQAVFKVVDPKGNTHRIRSELSVEKIKSALAQKGVSSKIQLEFVDDEGDAVVVTSDECLADAAHVARSTGQKVIKLTAKAKETMDQTMMMIAGAGVAVAAVGALAFLLGRPRK